MEFQRGTYIYIRSGEFFFVIRLDFLEERVFHVVLRRLVSRKTGAMGDIIETTLHAAARLNLDKFHGEGYFFP